MFPLSPHPTLANEESWFQTALWNQIREITSVTVQSQGKIGELECALGQTLGSSRETGLLVSTSLQAHNGHWPDLERESKVRIF